MKPARGFTLIEILFVIVILVLLVAGIVAAFSSFTGEQALSGTVENARSLLLDARSRTLASSGDSAYGVYFSASDMTLFAGSYSEGAAGNIVIPYDPRVSRSAISLSGSGSEVVFNRLSGSTDQSGTITFSLSSSSAIPAKVITISNSGLIQ